MVQAKTELFSEQLSETAVYFKLLSHPARLEILQFLAQSKTCISGDISDKLPLGRTTTNQHLKELRDAGLINSHTEGACMHHCLNTERLTELRSNIEDFLSQLDINHYTCTP